VSEIVAIKSLKTDPRNARKHSKKNLDAIKGSLEKFGQQKPIVVSENNIVIAGNGTLEAAKALGWKEIEIKRSSLKGADIKAYAIADNRSGELAEWDAEILGISLAALAEENFDLERLGFDEEDLSKIFPKEPKFSPGSEDEQGKLDEKKQIQCPECGHEFTP
jgi:ParB-like chromosome segregation protein Spo0J